MDLQDQINKIKAKLNDANARKERLEKEIEKRKPATIDPVLFEQFNVLTWKKSDISNEEGDSIDEKARKMEKQQQLREKLRSLVQRKEALGRDDFLDEPKGDWDRPERVEPELEVPADVNAELLRLEEQRNELAEEERALREELELLQREIREEAGQIQ